MQDTALMQRAVDGALDRLHPWLSRCTVVVVGPGLGDDPWVNATAARLIATAREMGLPLLVDGSGINIIVKVCSAYYAHFGVWKVPGLCWFLQNGSQGQKSPQSPNSEINLLP